MAVYTSINENELKLFLDQYNVGNLENFQGILEGIENTNYKIKTSEDNYILTIFEKRVNSKDIPFFVNLQNYLANKNFSCPKPIANEKGLTINSINGKLCILISYLDGKKIQNKSKIHCNQVGNILSTLHCDTNNYLEKRTNNMSLNQWNNILTKCKSLTIVNDIHLFNLIKKELIFLKANWPSNLPKGIIHADVFPDNVFFIKDKFSGLIDFYFACHDFLSYDIALTINAWCFNNNCELEIQNLQSLIQGYEEKRKITPKEKNSLTILLRGAAIRILLTRLHDKLFHPANAFVEPKDYTEYVKILKFHQLNNIKNFLK